MTRISPLLLALLLASTIPATAEPTGVPLRVLRPGTAARSGPVRFGVPLPRWENLRDSSLLSIVGPDGVAVPSQFRVLSRWDGTRDDATRPIKWVQVAFTAAVPAGTHGRYWMVRGGAAPAGTLHVSETATSVSVETAPGTRFELSRTALTLFERVTVDGAAVVDAPGGLIALRHDGSTLAALVTETVLEERGTVRAVVRQRGTLGPLRFTCRYHFHAGTAEVEVAFRLENPRAYGHFNGVAPGQVYLDSLRLVQPVAGTSGTATLTGPEGALPIRPGQRFDLRQRWDATSALPLDQWPGFSYRATLDGATVLTGNRHAGAVDLTGAAGGLTLVVDRFWQNHPKSLEVADGRIEAGLWPSWGSGPAYNGIYASPTSGDPVDPLAIAHYRFEGGRWKTHRMRFSFHAGARSAALVRSVAERTDAPLTGVADPAYTRISGAVAELYLERRPGAETSTARYERFWSILVDDSAADDQPGLGKIGLPGFIRRGATYGGRHAYGWANYGDLPWAAGFSSLHYDWCRSLTLGLLRTADYRFHAIARDMVAHRRDYDTNHSTDPAEVWRGAAFYEKGWYHGNYRFGEPSHTWLHGLLLHHVTTGDEAAREAALEGLAFVLRRDPANWNGYWGTRIAGWSLQNLIHGYWYLGHAVHRDEARKTIRNFERLEQTAGGMGYILNPGASPNSAAPWMHAVMLTGIAKYMLTTGDRAPLGLLTRIGDWLRTHGLIPGSGPVSARVLSGVYNQWTPAGGTAPSRHNLWSLVDAAAWSSVARWSDVPASDTAYALSSVLFAEMTHYHQRPLGVTVDGTDVASYSPVAMRMMMFPNTESKIIGNILLWGSATPAVAELRRLSGR